MLIQLLLLSDRGGDVAATPSEYSSLPLISRAKVPLLLRLLLVGGVVNVERVVLVLIPPLLLMYVPMMGCPKDVEGKLYHHHQHHLLLSLLLLRE